jgi:hypothetical protein
MFPFVANFLLPLSQIASLDEKADVIGKVADFGLSQQVLCLSYNNIH